MKTPGRTATALRAAVLCLTAPLWTGCLENEETIRIAPDGSVVVRVAARGDAADMADGYPVPLHGPWLSADRETRRWLDSIGGDTGTVLVQAAVAAGGWTGDEAELAVEGRFDGVEAIPRSYAPKSEPYGSAFLERSASLKVERKGERTIYTFERIYHGRLHPGWDHFSKFTDELPDGLMDDFAVLTDDELETVARAHADGFAHYAEAFVAHALSADYTLGEARLPLEARDRILRRTRDHVAALEPAQRLAAIGRWMRAFEREEIAEGEEHPLPVFTEEWRDALRRSLTEGLRAEGVEAERIHAIQARLELALTAFNYTNDLEDEGFAVTVELPGVVVDGNYDDSDGGSASWRFTGEDLKGADRVLRAISVLE